MNHHLKFEKLNCKKKAKKERDREKKPTIIYGACGTKNAKNKITYSQKNDWWLAIHPSNSIRNWLARLPKNITYFVCLSVSYERKFFSANFFQNDIHPVTERKKERKKQRMFHKIIFKKDSFRLNFKVRNNSHKKINFLLSMM